MTTTTCTDNLEQFRQQLYQNFNNRADTLMELVDGLCSKSQAPYYAKTPITSSLADKGPDFAVEQ